MKTNNNMNKLVIPEDIIDARAAARECTPKKYITPQMRQFASQSLAIASALLDDSGEGPNAEEESIQAALNTTLNALSVLIGDCPDYKNELRIIQ